MSPTEATYGIDTRVVAEQDGILAQALQDLEGEIRRPPTAAVEVQEHRLHTLRDLVHRVMLRIVPVTIAHPTEIKNALFLLHKAMEPYHSENPLLQERIVEIHECIGRITENERRYREEHGLPAEL